MAAATNHEVDAVELSEQLKFSTVRAMPVEATVRHTKWVADPHAGDVDAWLHGIEGIPADAREGTHFRRVLTARCVADDAVDELRAAVHAAREAGESWSLIGAGLGTSAEKAQELFENLT